MKRRLSSRSWRACLAACALLAAWPLGALAQSSGGEGALFLLVPVGARTVGIGQAVVADRPGSEAVWWNPAALGTADRREVAVHHSTSLLGTGDAVTLVWPSSSIGVIAASINIVDFGEQEVTSQTPGGEVSLGRLLPRGLVYAASYATTIGSRLSAGLSYKLVQFRVDCTGPCDTSDQLNASTSAVDFGVQVIPLKNVPLHVGASVRNLGLRLQVNDNAQADPIPRRLQVGARYVYVPPAHLVEDLELRISADLIDDIEVHRPSINVGGELAYQQRAFLRAGYAMEGGAGGSGPAFGGPALGLGLLTNNLAFDIARVFGGLSADAGQAPTFFSLRVLF